MKIIDFSQFGVFDFCVFGFVFIVFLIFFLLGMLFKHKIRIVFLSFSFILFLIMPLLVALIMNGFINRVEFSDTESRKLAYIENYFIKGQLTNRGVRVLNECRIGIYIKRFYPLKPEYQIILSKLDFAPKATLQIEETIANFKPDSIAYLKFRCF